MGVNNRQGGFGGERHDIFIVAGKRHFILPDAPAEFIRINPMMLGQTGKIQILMRDMKAYSFDAYFHLTHLLISAAIFSRHRRVP